MKQQEKKQEEYYYNAEYKELKRKYKKLQQKYGLYLEGLEQKLDDALEAETPESLTEFINEKREQVNVVKPCSSCKKQMVSAPYPKWICLRKNCDMYLKNQN